MTVYSDDFSGAANGTSVDGRDLSSGNATWGNYNTRIEIWAHRAKLVPDGTRSMKIFIAADAELPDRRVLIRARFWQVYESGPNQGEIDTSPGARPSGGGLAIGEGGLQYPEINVRMLIGGTSGLLRLLNQSTVLATYNMPAGVFFEQGDELGLSYDGELIRVYHNGTAVLTLRRVISDYSHVGFYFDEAKFTGVGDWSCRTRVDSGLSLQWPGQGIDSFSYDPNFVVEGVRTPIAISDVWAQEVRNLNPGLTMVRCKVEENSGTSQVDATQYNTAFARYTARGFRVFAVFPPEFYSPGGSHGEPDEGLDVNDTNTYITGFAQRAASVASACQQNVRDFIIWNEYTTTGTRLIAKNFAALLYRCYQEMTAELGAGNFDLYWGGIQLGPGDPNAARDALIANLTIVYQEFEQLGITEKFWSGVNVHIHHARFDLGATDQERNYMTTLFSEVQQTQEDHDDFSEIIVGEWGETISVECDENHEGSLEQLFDAIATCDRPPNKMFFFLHSYFVDLRTGNDWGIVNWEHRSATAQATFVHYERTTATWLFAPFMRQLAAVSGQPQDPSVINPAVQDHPCSPPAVAGGVWLPHPPQSRFLIGSHIHQPSTDPAYSAGTSFTSVDSTNVRLSFRPNGSEALVVASFVVELSADGSQASDRFSVNLRDANGDVTDSEQVVQRLVAANHGGIHRVTCFWELSGLTAGQWHLRDLGFKKSDSHLTALIHAGDDSAGGWGPITMAAYNI
jgi:hypothetical protein